MHAAVVVLAVHVLVLLVATVQSTPVVISNALPRRDTAGNIVDAHDGKVLFQDGVYYWYAASYGNCKEPDGPSGCSDAGFGQCGFRGDHNVSLFTSPDLATWTSHGPVFQMQYSGITNGILFCPKILYNNRTKLYILWFNWIAGADFSNSFYAVATSPSAFGPFTVVSPKVTTLAFTDTGDFNLLQDDDGSAYIIYTAHIQGFSETHRMSVEKLTPDYIATLGASASSGFFGQSFVEAPAIFKRDNIYYAVFGQCCCYCQSGSPVIVYTADSPLGPYTQRNAIDSAAPPFCKLSSYNRLAASVRASLCASGIAAQQTDIFGFLSTSGLQFMWMGDRWQSAPDGIKGHDFTYWYPLSFDPTGNVTAMKLVDNFTIDMP